MTKQEEINLYNVSNEPTKITEKVIKTEQEVNDWEALLLLFLLCNADAETIKRIKMTIIPEDNKELRNSIQEKIFNEYVKEKNND